MCPYTCRHTGRIGSRQHLEGGVLVVSKGCPGGAQRPHGDHIYPIQLGFRENPYFEKSADFPYACGNVVDLPHVAKRAFGDKIGPWWGTRHAVWHSPSSWDEFQEHMRPCACLHMSIAFLLPPSQLKLLVLHMSVPFGTGTTDIAESRFWTGCNRTLGGLGSTKNKILSKELGLSIEFDPSNGSFQGVYGLVLVPEEKQILAWMRRLGIRGSRLRTHTGHGTSEFVEMNVLEPGKNAKPARAQPY